MEVIINHMPDQGAAMAEAKNADWIRTLRGEHADYYGAPHGQSGRGEHPVRFLGPPVSAFTGNDWTPRPDEHDETVVKAGFIDPEVAAVIWMATVVDTAAPWPSVKYVLDILSLPRPSPLGGWMTSGGNLTLVCGAYEYRRGTRYGLRNAQVTGEHAWVHYIDTMCPSASPDAFGLVPAGRIPQDTTAGE